MSPNFYKVLHLVGLLLVFLSLGALVARARLAPGDRALRRTGSILGGVGLLLLLVSGFGLQAKLQYAWETWLIVKIGIWVGVGSLPFFLKAEPARAWLWAAVALALGLLAAVMGVYKPV